MWVVRIEECSLQDVPLVGGKCASLGELARAGKNVPPGFAVTAEAYRRFLLGSPAAGEVARLAASVPPGADASAYSEVARAIRGIILSSPVPAEVAAAVRQAYAALCRRCGQDEVPVAVRSSSVSEDSASASFAGQHETFLNVRGGEDVLAKTLECWASLFSAPALHYRAARGFDPAGPAMAVGIQKMVDSRSSGVVFTVDPVAGDPSKIVVEGAWGLGEGIVSGEVTPDHFTVDKETLVLCQSWISPKTVEFVPDPRTGLTVRREVPAELREAPCLGPEELRRLCQIAVEIERHYGRPQDIEWAVERQVPFPQNIAVLQSRPVTAWGDR